MENASVCGVREEERARYSPTAKIFASLKCELDLLRKGEPFQDSLRQQKKHHRDCGGASFVGGESEIRTRGRLLAEHTISSRAP